MRELSEETELTEIQHQLIDDYLEVLFQGSIPTSQVPDGTTDWERAIWIPLKGLIVVGNKLEESHSSIINRSVSAFSPNDYAICGVTFEGDKEYFAVDSDTILPKQPLPSSYTLFYHSKKS